MKFGCRLSLFCLYAATIGCSTTAFASDMYGNPTVIGSSGTFDIQVGGGKSKDLALDVSKSTTSYQVGSLVTGTQSMAQGSGNIGEDQVFLGVAYTVNAHVQLLATFGNGKGSDQTSRSRSFGFKLVPESDSSSLKMGFVMRAQQVTSDTEGPFYYWMPFSDSTNYYYLNTPLNGSEQLKYTRLDAFFGASAVTGVIRPYGGLALSRISGTDTLDLNDTISVNTAPIAGGGQTTSTQHVVIHNKADLSSSQYFTGVIGVSINPDSQLGLTAEFQAGVQKTFMLAGNIRF